MTHDHIDAHEDSMAAETHIRDVDLARTIAVYEDEGRNISAARLAADHAAETAEAKARDAWESEQS